MFMAIITHLQSLTLTTTRGGFASRFAIGDINGDGKTDVAITLQSRAGWGIESGNNPVIFLQQGVNGQFQNATNTTGSNNITLIEPTDITPINLNNDNKTDFVVAQGGLDVYVKDTVTGALHGTGVFSGASSMIYGSTTSKMQISSATNLQSFYHDSDIADLNGDGLVDIIILGVPSNTVILLNDGKGNLISRTDLIPSGLINQDTLEVVLDRWSNGANKTVDRFHYHSLTLVDVNRDGFSDIFVSGEGSYNLLYLNNGQGNFSTSTPIKVPQVNAIAGSDLKTYATSNGIATTLTVKGADMVYSVAIDINNDGWKDIIGLSTYNDYNILNRGGSEVFHKGGWVQALINNGQGLTDATQEVVNSWHGDTENCQNYDRLEIVDLNGDGYNDFLVAHNSYGTFMKNNIPDTVFFLNDTKGHFTPYTIPGLPNNNYTSVPINGKVGLVGLSDLNGNSTNTGDYQVDTWTTTIPWTIGDNQNNFLQGTPGVDTIDGQGGVDTFVANYRYSNDSIKINADHTVTIKGLNGETDTLVNVERVKFDDRYVAVDRNAQEIFLLHEALVQKAPDANTMGILINTVDQGMSIRDLTSWAVSLPVIQDLLHIHIQNVYLDDQNAGALVDQLYSSILHRTADLTGHNFCVDGLKTHQFTVADIVYGLTTSAEMHQLYDPIMLTGITYTPILT